MSGTDFRFWFEVVVALFIGFFMLLNYRKYRDRMFNLLFFWLMILLIKSAVYIAIDFTNVIWVEEMISGNTVKVLDKTLVPLYNLRYFIFHYFETMFVLFFAFMLGSSLLKAQEKKTLVFNILFIAQAVIATGFAAFILIYSMMNGDASNYQTDNFVIELFKTTIGKLIFVAWRLALLIYAWSVVAAVYGYIANILRIIIRYKRLLYTYISLEIFLAFFSSFVSFYAYPIWIILQVVGVIFISVFAYGNHTGFVRNIQERVDNLTREKDTIISLMREISVVVGSGTLELDSVIQTIVDNSVKGTIARGGAILIKDPITNRLNVQYVRGLYPPSKPLKNVQSMAVSESMVIEKFRTEKIAVGEGLLGKVVETGEPIYIPDVLKDTSYVQTVSDMMLVTSFIAVPLKSKTEVFGVLSVVDDSKLFLENDLSLIETLGEQAAITISQFQMYQQILDKKAAEKEIGVAAEIQNSLIPHTFPSTSKYEVYGFSIAAKGVGGDYYDYIDFGNDKIVLTMFDVSGKGVPAALIMVMIRSILRTIATLNEDTKDVLSKLNNTIAAEIVEDRYATGFYLLFDAEKGIMSYTNAGHGPLILYRAATDSFEFLDTEGMPIGIMSGVEYGQNYTILEKGDLAILYTDGISEAMNMAHEEFGLDRFKEVIRKNRRESAREICNRVLEAVNLFAGNAPQHDDETLLVLKNK